MGKGRRNRERNLQDRLATPVAKNLKNKKKSGMPSWLTSVIALVVVAVILLPLIISGIQESGFFQRRRVLIESQTGKFDVNQQMATFIAWESLYESGLQYYQYMQIGFIQDTSGITSYYTADQYAMNMAYAGVQNNLRDSVDGVVDLLKQYVAVCDLAHKEGVTLTEEEKGQIDDVVAWLNEMRAGTAFTSLDKFLGYTIGTGIKEKDVREATEMVLLYNKYVQEKQLALDEKITLDNLINYREENPESFYKIDYLTYAVKNKELSEQLKACKTPLEFNNLIIKIFFDENYKAIYNQYTLQVEVSEILKDKLTGKTDAADGSGTALSDAWKELGVEESKEYSKDDKDLDADLSTWLFSTKRKQYESGMIVGEDSVYLVSFYSANDNAGKDKVEARVKAYDFKDGASHNGDDKFMETLLKVLTANNNGEDEKVEYAYKTASEKANALLDEMVKEGADVEKLLKDAGATDVVALTEGDTTVPPSVRKKVFSSDVETGKPILLLDNDVYYLIYIRSIDKPSAEVATADAATEEKKTTANIAYVKYTTDLFCSILDTLDEALTEDFSSDASSASFLKETTEGSYQEFLFELKEGEGWVSARKNGDTIVIESTKDNVTTYSVYMAVAHTDFDEKGEMLYFDKSHLVNGGYLLFTTEDAAKAALEQVKGKTGDDLVDTFAGLSSDDSANTVKASETNAQTTVESTNKDLAAWMFDAARKDGDVAIVEKKNASTDKVEGYYLVYYVDYVEKWESTARSSLLSKQLQDWIAELSAPYTVNEKVLNKIGKPTPEETEAETAA